MKRPSRARGAGAVESGLVRLREASSAPLLAGRSLSSHADGPVVGAGFLVAPDIVCTCAHVVADALGLSRDTEDAPTGKVRVDFPLIRDADGRIPAVSATVVSWQPTREEDDSGDVALLRLDHAVAGARPVPLVDGTAVWGHEFRAYGFPTGGDHGAWATGSLRGVQGAGWLQMDAGSGGAPIQPGFSGSAVWDDAQGGVIGMTVAAGRGGLNGTAYLVPSFELVDEDVVAPRCPFRGLGTFDEDDAAFFHGRGADVERLRRAVRTRPVTVLAGPSGCGKSSLIRAGLLPGARADGLTVSLMRPVAGLRAEAVLAQALTAVLVPDDGETDRLRRAAELTRLLSEASDETATAEVASGLRSALRRQGGRAGHLFVVDQMEEYAGAAPGAARRLFQLLFHLCGTVDGEFGSAPRAVVTARPDSIEALMAAETSSALSDAVMFLAPLGPDGVRDAITRPVDAVPGLWLEPGLADRIVRDAADEPGRMPLVEFALTRLWEQRERSMLTHAVYQDLGGIAGALTGYAEDSFRAVVREDEIPVAQALFVQLARPEDQGGYTRRPAPVADMDPAVLALARRLSPGRLIVFGRTDEGTEIVDLAHEALTRHWQRLKNWLDDSRKFRTWQEDLRRDLTRWKQTGRDPGALLRGSMLEVAVEHAALRPTEITALERAYIGASRKFARRALRRWQAVVATLLALLVGSGVLADMARDSSQKAERQLHTLVSRALADESGDRASHDPGSSFQLALAAWNADDTPQAQEALLRSHVTGEYLRDSHVGLWPGRAMHLDTTPDGHTLVVWSKPASAAPAVVSVVTGALGSSPGSYALRGAPTGENISELSSDGRHYAVATPDGRVFLWRLDGEPRDPLRLRTTDTADRVVKTADLDFSADGTRLLRLLDSDEARPLDLGRRGIVEAWNVSDGASLPVAKDLVPSGVTPDEAAFGEDPDTVVLRWTRLRDLVSVVELRQLGSGGFVRQIVTGVSRGTIWLHGGGDYAVEQRGKDLRSPVYVHNTTTGVSRRLPGSSLLADDTDGYVMQDQEAGGFTEVALTRLPTGETFRTRVPRIEGEDEGTAAIAAVRRASEPVTVLATVGGTLMVLATEPGAPLTEEEFNPSSVPDSLSPDGGAVAWVTDVELYVRDTVSGRGRSVKLPASGSGRPNWRVAWTPEDRRLVVWQSNGTELLLYEADDLERRRAVHLDVGPDPGEPRGALDWVTPLAGGDIAALTVGGSLLRVDSVTGLQVGRPVSAEHTDGALIAPFRSAGQLVARPAHPHQVAVVTRAGVTRGTIQLWDIFAGRRIGFLSGDAIRPVFADFMYRALAFSADGRDLLAQSADGTVHRWSVDQRTITGRPMAVDPLDHVVSMASDGTAITESASGYDLWATDTGRHIGAIPTVLDVRRTAIVYEDRMVAYAKGWRQTYDLLRANWFSHLCSSAGRDYTEEERKHFLPVGTPPGLPCENAHPWRGKPSAGGPIANGGTV
ncbi:trypsin-like peptidase domain-containing protein [Streptomyces laculatispora]|uniref:Trypsin-like peptidase domain-containing protein n=1 Tax=Streptomyces laculatispora TaxID=887464 RepID=A0ABY9HW57_9ACTN|nr:trypsin-like peptidase domain-containing protein [Streptomyces laculatispora]WLQ38790.1 trypsin-like peptidase domain-containing protein [Streptomyces laculatispora]